MKRFVLPLIILIMVFGVYGRTFADKGRKHYEEAGQIIWEINTEEKVIALTFDDGPHRKHTTEILDLLKKHEAKATFFIVGANAEKNPDVVLRMYEEGHELANHTYSHKTRMNVSQLIQELKKTDEVIYSITGQSSKLFRPVEGQYTDEIVQAVSREGYKLVMWSWHLDTLDWKNPGVDKIVGFVLNGAKEGNVVLFHDGGGNRRQTVEALEKILPALEKQGYTFVTISDMMKINEKNNKGNTEDRQIENYK